MSAPSPRPVRPPVEDLSDLSWARVERRLWSELDRTPDVAPARAAVRVGRRRWPWLAAGVLVAAAAIAVVAWPAAHDPARSTTSRVATAHAATEVTFGDAAITVAPSSAVLLQGEADRGAAVVLERGSATFAVAPRRGRPPFQVLVGAVQVRVIGTRFTVTRSGDDARVDVADGEVEVVAWGRREVLLAGASWSSDGVREAAVGGSATVTNPGGVAAAHFLPSPAPAPVEPPPGPAAVTRARPPASSAPRVQPQVAVPPAAEVPAPVAAAAVTELRRRFEAASDLEVRDPAAALRAYRALSSDRGPWGANALFAAARLAFGQGDRDLAARFARAYLTRFAAGPNAADARALLERATGPR